MESVLQSKSLIQRAYWLVHLRWVAVAVLVCATFLASETLKVSLAVSALYTVAAAVAVYNFVLFDLLRYLVERAEHPSLRMLSRIITFQIGADFVILTVILHYSGGIENPFFFSFIFHVVIASTILSTLQSYLAATFAVAVFGTLTLLESFGVLAHYELVPFVSVDFFANRFYVLGTLFVFSATLYLVVYMTTSIMKQLRRQQEGFELVNLQLKQKDYYKNEYILRLTHDIKGHLAAIDGCLNVVREKIVGPLNDKQMDLIERGHNRAVKCLAFVNALLKLTRMKLTGRLDMELFSLKRSIFNAFAAAENGAKAKNLEYAYEMDTAVDTVYGESTLIEETITNMLLNSVKYTPAGGIVKLSVKDAKDHILIQISDSGIGIPPDETEKIFEEFYRAANARKVERDGTGLGLSIAKQVVTRHHGKIWAQNNPEGGSTFSFTIPKDLQSHPEAGTVR